MGIRQNSNIKLTRGSVGKMATPGEVGAYYLPRFNAKNFDEEQHSIISPETHRIIWDTLMAKLREGYTEVTWAEELAASGEVYKAILDPLMPVGTKAVIVYRERGPRELQIQLSDAYSLFKPTVLLLDSEPTELATFSDPEEGTPEDKYPVEEVALLEKIVRSMVQKYLGK